MRVLLLKISSWISIFLRRPALALREASSSSMKPGGHTGEMAPAGFSGALATAVGPVVEGGLTKRARLAGG